ncbi:MAG: DHHA1 domain-containing protein [Eubacteriales bacterium]|nr:DHHA1 domain-containing protein [Eubacteriales bacterium]
MTRRLYYEDAYRKEFDAQVISCREAEGGFEVILDQTVFYPEGGGQPCDLGILICEEAREEAQKDVREDAAGGQVSVLDVQDGGDEVRHFCDRPLQKGMRVHGKIDWTRRLTHMREHSGEHIISGIICKSHGYSNIGFHMGKEFVTIDFNGMLTEEEIAEAQKAANAKVLENVEILAEYPDAETLQTMEYRSKKELDGAIRIVTVPGADCCACCGTHVKRTGEIGPIRVIGTEHYKNGIRLNILIGEKALADYAQKSENTKKISTLLSVKPENTAEAVDKLLNSFNCLKLEYGALKMQLLEQKVEAIGTGEKSVVLFERDLSPTDVRKLADRLQEKAEFSAVFSGDDAEGYKYVIISSKLDVAAFGKELNRALNGRGGGRNPMIQGSALASRREIEAFLKEKELL